MKYRIILKYETWTIYAEIEYANILIDKREYILHPVKMHLNRLPFCIKYERY